MPRLTPLSTSPAAPAPQGSAQPSESDLVTSATLREVADPQKFQVQPGPSLIDGTGAFAAEPIPEKRKIGEIRGEFVPMVEARRRAKLAEQTSGRIFMVAISDKRAVDATQSTDALRFANHSCQPNMVLKVQQGRVAFYALRDIAQGEELTVRYGETHHAGRLQCRCGAPGCQGRL